MIVGTFSEVLLLPSFRIVQKLIALEYISPVRSSSQRVVHFSQESQVGAHQEKGRVQIVAKILREEYQ